MILYCVYANAVLSQPMKGIYETELVTAYTKIQQKLVNGGFKPQLHHLEN